MKHTDLSSFQPHELLGRAVHIVGTLRAASAEPSATALCDAVRSATESPNDPVRASVVGLRETVLAEDAAAAQGSSQLGSRGSLTHALGLHAAGLAEHGTVHEAHARELAAIREDRGLSDVGKEQRSTELREKFAEARAADTSKADAARDVLSKRASALTAQLAPAPPKEPTVQEAVAQGFANLSRVTALAALAPKARADALLAMTQAGDPAAADALEASLPALAAQDQAETGRLLTHVHRESGNAAQVRAAQVLAGDNDRARAAVELVAVADAQERLTFDADFLAAHPESASDRAEALGRDFGGAGE